MVAIMEIKSKYFKGEWHITREVMNKYGLFIGNMIISLIDELRRYAELDYLLIINMNFNGSKQVIRFSWQENHDGVLINHCREFMLDTEGKYINDKFYVIDDGSHSTILFPNEY